MDTIQGPDRVALNVTTVARPVSIRSPALLALMDSKELMILLTSASAKMGFSQMVLMKLV